MRAPSPRRRERALGVFGALVLAVLIVFVAATVKSFSSRTTFALAPYDYHGIRFDAGQLQFLHGERRLPNGDGTLRRVAWDGTYRGDFFFQIYPWPPLSFRGTGKMIFERTPTSDPARMDGEEMVMSARAMSAWLAATVIASPLCLIAWLRHRRHARKPGMCDRCGYDLRATPDRCPECGRDLLAH